METDTLYIALKSGVSIVQLYNTDNKPTQEVDIMSPDEYREKQLKAPLAEKWKPELSNGVRDFKLHE